MSWTERMTQTVELTVTGEQKIHCARCEQRIANALRGLSGVQDVRASADTQRVVVAIDAGQIAPGDLRAKLAELGYDVA